MGRGSETVHGPVRMWLTVYSGQVPIDSVEVDKPSFTIGRDEHCDLVIHDPKVSREHAVIVPGAGPFRRIRDLGSENGTLVNGEPIRSPAGFAPTEVREADLSGGEWLHFGDTTVRVTLADPASVAEQVVSEAPKNDPED